MKKILHYCDLFLSKSFVFKASLVFLWVNIICGWFGHHLNPRIIAITTLVASVYLFIGFMKGFLHWYGDYKVDKRYDKFLKSISWDTKKDK